MAKFDRRTSFVCYPATAAAAFTIDPGWLTILRPGFTPKIITAVGEQSVTARVECKHTWSVKVGDILSDEFDDRVLLVKQVERKQQRQELLCEELRRPIPDEFDTYNLRAYWELQYATLAHLSTNHLSLSVPVTSSLAAAGICGQWVKGDFDVWVYDAGVGYGEVAANGAVSYGFLAARDANGNGVAIGIRRTGNGTTTVDAGVRLDRTGGSQYTTTAGTGQNYRLKRSGDVLRTFASATDLDDVVPGVIPEDYAYPVDFWSVTYPTSTEFISSADLFVGWGGMTTHSSNAQARQIRNWRD